MRTSPSALALLLCIGFPGCMDHSGSATPDRQPAPVSDPDQTIIDPAPAGPNAGGSVGASTTDAGTNTSGASAGGSGSGGGPAGGPVPEPGTMLLVGSGMAAAAFLRRKRKIAH